MNIIIAIKPVRSSLLSYIDDQAEPYVINPYDLYALKKCIDVKTKFNFTISCISMGPISSQQVLVKALALGADEAYLISDRAFSGSDTVATTYILSQAIKKIGLPDILVFGERSIDGETGQVVHGLSERLGFYGIDGVSSIDDIVNGMITLTTINAQNKLIIKVKAPVSIAFKDFETTLPTISLLNLKRAQNKQVHILDADQIEADYLKCGINGSRTKVFEVQNEFNEKAGQFIGGDLLQEADFIRSQLI